MKYLIICLLFIFSLVFAVDDAQANYCICGDTGGSITRQFCMDLYAGEDLNTCTALCQAASQGNPAIHFDKPNCVEAGATAAVRPVIGGTAGEAEEGGDEDIGVTPEPDPVAETLQGCICGIECRILPAGQTCTDLPLECDPPTPCDVRTYNPPTESPGDGVGTIKLPETTKLENPLASGSTDIPTIIGNVIKGVMGIMGALVLLMMVWGATTWLTSAGNAEKVKAGTQTMVWAVIGAIVTVSSYVILNTILQALAGKL